MAREKSLGTLLTTTPAIAQTEVTSLVPQPVQMARSFARMLAISALAFEVRESRMAFVVCPLIIFYGSGSFNTLEPECCDGSDERPGICPNICKSVGEAHKKKVAEQRKVQKTVRSTF